MYGSYSQELAESASQTIRDEIQEGDTFRKFFPDVEVSRKSSALHRWMTADRGKFRAAGVGGSLTGMGATYAVVDDPFKDRVEADSRATQKKVWQWFTQVMRTRLTPDARLIVMHTRWSEGDLIGRIKDELEKSEDNTFLGLKWKVLELRGISEDENDPLGREPGEPLWPENGFDLKQLEGIRQGDPHGFAALYQQRPRPLDALVFGPAHYYLNLPMSLRYGRGADLAYTKNSRSNFSAMYEVGENDGYYYVLYGERWQSEISETIDRIRAIQTRFPGTTRVEINGPQIGIFQTLENAGLRMDGYNPVGDKYARALPLIEAWNTGKILLPSPERYPESADWVYPLLKVIQKFTGSGNETDDDVDALGNAITQLQANLLEVDFEALSKFGIGLANFN